MLIECLIKRDGPTHVTLAGFDYVFDENKEGRKVCDVLSTDHQAHFLALKDYIPYKPAAPYKVEPAEDPEPEPELLGKPDGTPYANKGAARRGASQHHNLEPDQVNIVAVEDGFAIEVKEQ